MRLLFIVNPISGGVDKEPFLKEAKELCNSYGIEYSIFKTTGQNDEKMALKQLHEFQPNKVVSVGGDGTTLFTAITLLETDYPMGIIPLGSANGMATELFVNPVPIQALQDLIMSQIIGDLDLILVNNEHYTMHVGDVGINAKIVESYEKDANRGMVTYAKYFIEELGKTKPFHVHVQTDSEEYEGSVVMSAICNARKYGTGVPLNLIGNPMDGKFELVFVEKIDLASLIRSGLSSFNENYFDNQVSTVIQGKKAKLTFDEPLMLQLDGEIIEKYKTIDVELVPGAVKLITTTKNKNIIQIKGN